MPFIHTILTTCLLGMTTLPGAMAADKLPVITFEETEHDFGNFSEEMNKVTCEFKFTNTGDAPLIITQATATCGCTRPQYPRQPVEPGESGVVSVTYNAKGRPGAFRKNVYVYTNAEPAKATLVIKGNVIRSGQTQNSAYPFSIGGLKLKATHVPFFDVYTHQPKTERIEIINTAKTTVTPEFADVPEHLRVSSRPVSLQPGEKGEILITYLPEAAHDWGMHSDNFHVVVPGVKKDTSNLVSVSADIREDYSHLTPEEIALAPRLSLSGTTLDFGTIRDNDPVEKTVQIRNTGKSKLVIRKINNQSGILEASMKKMYVSPGKSAELKVKIFPARMKNNILNHRIFIITNAPESPTVSLRVLGTFE